MNYISFKNIKIENFLSIGSNSVEIKLDNKINIITGRNLDKEDSKNGVGKSTIVDALYFALYGTTLREIPKELIVNSSTTKNCKVELTFTVEDSSKKEEYTVIRTIGPTKCTLLKDGVNVTLSTMAKTTELLQSLLNCSGKVFQNSVVMSINNTIPFLAQSKVDKRKYIENMLQLEVFSQMLLQARSEYTELKHTYDITRVTHTRNLKDVESLTKQISDFNNEKQKDIDAIKIKAANLTESYKNLQKELEDLKLISIDTADYSREREILNNKSEGITNIIININSKRSTIVAEQQLLKTQIKQLKNKKEPCPTCNRGFNNDDNCEHLITELNQKLNSITTDVFDLDIAKQKDLLLKIKKTVNALDAKETSQRTEVITHNTKKTQVQTRLETTQTTIKDLDNTLRIKQLGSNQPLLDELDHANTLYSNSLNLINEQESQLKILDSVKYILSEDGVKTFLVKKILKVLNQKIQHYLNLLEAPVKCAFDEFFDENITDEKNRVKSYFNFSGGERKRIDLACLFSFMDMKRLQGETVFNTTFYDELLDSSLDEKGVDLVLDVLRERNNLYKEGCYIITHRGQHVLDKVDNIITLEKRNDFTYILKNNEL